MNKKIVFKNKIEEVTRVAEFIEQVGEELELSFAVINSIQLAIEEAVVNVINYAYPKDKECEAYLDVSKKDNAVYFVLSDTGVPFDPTAKSDPDLTLSADERPIGGLGIFLVKQIMNEVTYEYSDGKNNLIMIKRI